MTGLVFVDTNVLVYAHDAGAPVKQSAAIGWLEELWRESRARTSMQVLNEYYVTLTRKIRPAPAADDVWDAVRSLLSWNPQAIDANLLRAAWEVQQRHHLSWWDCLIVAAANAQDCVLLLTEDLQDGASYGGVTIRNPFTFGVAEAAAQYAAPAPLPSWHRPRGRPRRVSAAT